MKMATRVLIAAGLITATMTKLRHSGTPLGVGEVLLLLFILAVLPGWLREVLRHRLDAKPWRHVSLIGCYAALFVMLMVGCWQGNQSGVNPYAGSVRDMLAYAFCFLVSVGIVVNSDGPGDVARTLRDLTWVGLSVSAIIWIWAIAFGALGEFNLWYGGYGARFTGLAINPNQNALLLVSLPFLLFFLLRTSAAGLWERRFGIAVGAIGLAAGWSTGSAALRFIWIALIPMMIMAGMFFHSELQRARRDYALTVGLGAMLISLSSESMLSRVHELFGDVLPGTGTMNTDLVMLTGGAGWTDRLILWKNAWVVLQGSPVFGYGPGALSGMRGHFGGSEAHNSLLDWMMATGFLGGVVLTALVSVVLWRSARQGSIELFFALLALWAFGMAHHVLRHPWMWAMWTLLAVHVGGLHGSRSRAGSAPNDAKADVTCAG